MHNLVRRSSGYYALRLVVPKDLRDCVGRTEINESTGTREIALAKIVAGLAAARWRQRFIELRRLKAVASIHTMTPDEILRLTSGSPALHGESHLPLRAAARASGIGEDQLLRLAAEGRLGLWCRVPPTLGALVQEGVLEPVDPAVGPTGGFVVPAPAQMPASAVPHVASGLLAFELKDIEPTATRLLGGSAAEDCVAFAAPGREADSGWWFVPDKPVRVDRRSLEVSAAQVENVRRDLAKLVSPEQVQHARVLEKAALTGPASAKSPHADKLLSEALDHFVKHRLRHTQQNEGEITRIRNGCALLIELDGDVAIGTVTTERLRAFRDTKLAQVPARENKIRLMHGTRSMSESMARVAGTSWAVMSAGEREKRMRWICGWFYWLHQQRWLLENPAGPLHGESVMSIVDRRKKSAKRADEVRSVFSRDDLHALFSEQWFRTGRGTLTKQGTYREFMPHYYWAPLLALLAGGARANEVAQLHLSDFGVTPAGTAYVDFQASEDDQKLKNQQSRRRVPLHPLLEKLGLPEWVAALAAAGHTRLFPELKRDAEKGYGKPLTKWFTRYMTSRGYPRDGSLTFHSFRHTFTNALPADTPERVRKQFTGHVRGNDAHDTTYRKDLDADQALPYIERLGLTLPDTLAPFDVEQGLRAVEDALRRKAS